MTEPLRTLVWSWYGAEDIDKISAFMALGHALSKLALSPLEKDVLLPDCIHCELLNEYCDANNEFLEKCSGEVSSELILIAKRITNLLENLSPEEAACFSRTAFSLPGWLEAQKLSTRALEIIDWAEISKYELQLS
jgi:hypothetical protein